MASPTAPLLARKKLLGALAETTMGTINTPLAANLMAGPIYDAKLVPDDMFSEGRRQPHGHYLGDINAIPGAQTGTLTYREELCYAGTFITMLTGCGFRNSAGTTYVEYSDQQYLTTWSFKLWEDGRYKLLHGASGTCRIEGTAGGRVFANWTWRGKWGAAADEAMPTQAALSTVPYRAVGATLSVGQLTSYISSFSIDLGVQLEARESVVDATGILYFHCAARAPRITIDPEAMLIATDDPLADFLLGTEGTFSLALADVSGNSLTITAPALQIMTVGDEDRGGRLVDALECQCNASAGDDELQFVSAAAP